MYEKPVYATIPLMFGLSVDIPTGKTIRTIEGIDVKTNQRVSGTIGNAGVWEVYQIKTDQEITEVKNAGTAAAQKA